MRPMSSSAALPRPLSVLCALLQDRARDQQVHQPPGRGHGVLEQARLREGAGDLTGPAGRVRLVAFPLAQLLFSERGDALGQLALSRAWANCSTKSLDTMRPSRSQPTWPATNSHSPRPRMPWLKPTGGASESGLTGASVKPGSRRRG